jgi:hypothetical protein
MSTASDKVMSYVCDEMRKLGLGDEVVAKFRREHSEPVRKLLKASTDKAPVDPKKPKGYANPYMQYFLANRTTVTTTNKQHEITTILAERWGKMTDEEKQEYVELAAIDRERHDIEMANYKPSPEYLQALETYRSQQPAPTPRPGKCMHVFRSGKDKGAACENPAKPCGYCSTHITTVAGKAAQEAYNALKAESE